MSTKKLVKVFWYPSDERGRKTYPGQNYRATFRSQSSEATDWSVFLDLKLPFEHQYLCDAMMSFVSHEVPLTITGPGYAFYLCEGRWPVAEGVFLQEVDTKD